MQSIGHVNSPTSGENLEVLGSLTLDGTGGKVLAVLDERMLSFESKTGHITSIRLSEILHTHHHNSRLAPFWVAFLGVIFVWFGYRIIDPLNFRLGTMVLGGLFISTWILTGKPTLTIETKDNVCFAIMGNDARLMRMNHLVQRINQGMTLKEARDGLELLERDTDYPGVTILEESLDMLPPVKIETPTSITTFLGNTVEESPMAMFDSAMFSSDEEQVLEAEPVLEVDMELPDWFTEGEPELDVGLLPSFSADGLIQRANGNIETRRHNGQGQYQYGAQSNPVHNPPIPSQMSYQEQFGAQQNYNNSPQMHQVPINNQQPVYNQIGNPNPMPMQQNMNLPMAGDSPIRPSQNNPDSHLKREAGESQLPDSLPNFWNKDGPYVTQTNQTQQQTDSMDSFNVPDSLSNSLLGNGERSIIANARSSNEVATPHPNYNQENQKQNKVEKFSNLKKRDNSVNNHSRLKIQSRAPMQSRGVVGRLVSLSIRAGARRATSVAKSASRAATNATRTVLGRESGYDVSESTESLRVRTTQNLREEALSSIQNLSENKGGNLPQHEVDRMHQHINRTNSLIEQREQNELESISFDDLVDSEAHISTRAGKSGLPRLDS
jgi:hypothetical protein